MLQHLKPYLKPYRREFIVGPAFKLLEAVLELTLPVLMAGIIDTGIANRDTAYIYRTGLKMLAIIVIGLTSALICQYSASVASQGFGTKVRSALFSHINHLPMEELDRFGTDTLVTRVTNDINQLQIAVSMLIRLVVRAPFVSIGCVAAAMMLDLKLSVVIIIGVLSFILVLAAIMLTAFPLYSEVQRRLDDIGGVVRENFSGVRVIRAFARSRAEIDRFSRAVVNHAGSVIRVTRIASLMTPLTQLIMNLVICAILWFGAVGVNAGEITQGRVIAFINYIAQILTALIAVANLVVIFTKASASLTRVNEIFDTKTGADAPDVSGDTGKNREDRETSDRRKVPEAASVRPASGDAAEPALRFSHVTFSYAANDEGDPERDVLADLSFSVPRGGELGIIGGTGSGKSTVLMLIARFYDAREGKITLDGKDIRSFSTEEVRSRIGSVFQQPKLFSGTVAENIRWGNDQADDEALRTAAANAQASEFIESLPGKYESRVDRDGRNLSGGQKQRLAIARALVRNPDILLLDDMASALDFLTEARLRRSIRDLREKTGVTVIMVSQRVASIRDAGQILVLDEGRAAGFGTHEELMRSCEIYRSIALSQMSEAEVM
jgi:ATP-binding cassette subfamily B protein